MADLLKGIDFDPAKIGAGATTTSFWRNLETLGVVFAYARFFDGLEPPSWWEKNKLIACAMNRPNAGKDSAIKLGAYCVLDPNKDGRLQAKLFIDYLLENRWTTPASTFAYHYRLRPALWLIRPPEDQELMIENALYWLETIEEFLSDQTTTRTHGELYDRPIVAMSNQFAASYDISPLDHYNLWIFDRAQDSKQKKPSSTPAGFEVDLWQKYPSLEVMGQPIGWDYSVDIGKSRGHKGSKIPVITVGLMVGLGGLAYWLHHSSKKTEARRRIDPWSLYGV